MTVLMPRRLQFLSDGERAALIFHEDGEKEVAAILRNPFVNVFTLTRGDTIDVSSMGNMKDRIALDLPTADISLHAEVIKIQTDYNLALELDIFNQYSVRDLLEIINRKLDRRVK